MIIGFFSVLCANTNYIFLLMPYLAKITINILMSIPTKCKNLRLGDLQFSFIWESEYSLIMNKTKYFTELAEGPKSVLGRVVVTYYQEQTVSPEEGYSSLEF